MTAALYQALLQPWTEVYFQRAMLGGLLVAVVSGVIGCFVILRRMAFLGDALAHAMLPGVAGGYLLMKLLFGAEAHAPAMLLGSLLAAVATVALIGLVTRASRIKEDTAIGIMYTGAFALGGLLVSLFRDRIHIDLIHFVLGDVLAVSDGDLWTAAIVAGAVLAGVLLFFRHLQLASFDPVMAAAIGMPVVAIDYFLTLSTSLVVVSGVRMVGVILVIGLLITPAATAYLLCDRLSRMLAVSTLAAASSVVGGLYLAVWLGVSGAAPIVLFGTAQFLAVLVASPRYGLLARWLRLRRMVPQQVLEKILRAALRADGAAVLVAGIAAEVQLSGDRLARLLRRMQKQGLIELAPGTLKLTETGLHEARRILRAHRLWESYLAHLGTQPEAIHAQAERLQHLHDEAAVDYLDDKLGHPLRDPHGAEIPEDFVHVVPGRAATLALLREGHVASVVAVGPAVSRDLPALRPGQRLIIGPRLADDTLWTVELPTGQRLTLDHGQADQVTVRVEH